MIIALEDSKSGNHSSVFLGLLGARELVDCSKILALASSMSSDLQILWRLDISTVVGDVLRRRSLFD